MGCGAAAALRPFGSQTPLQLFLYISHRPSSSYQDYLNRAGHWTGLPNYRRYGGFRGWRRLDNSTGILSSNFD